jgi:tetratricopeptide (TPR) repeat protein
MKKGLWILAFALSSLIGTDLQAQTAEEVRCDNNLQIFGADAQAKNFSDSVAFFAWSYVYNNCPASSKLTYIYGPYFVEAQIKNPTFIGRKKAAKLLKSKAKADSLKLATIQDSLAGVLMDVYDQRIKFYPEKVDYVMYRKGVDMMQYFPDSTQAAHKLFVEALEVGGPEQDAAFYDRYFITAVTLFNDKVFDVNQVFNSYNIVLEGIEVNTSLLNQQILALQTKADSNSLSDADSKDLAKAERELERYEKVESNAEKILAPISTCEKLTLLYNEETYQANKTDATWLRRASAMLSKEKVDADGEKTDCTDNPIFFKIAEELYRLEPTVKAARAMGLLAYGRKEYSKAIQYFTEAANKEADPKQAAADQMRIAAGHLKLGSAGSAKNAALKAASLRKNWGDPYLLIAQIYASVEQSCGNNVFEKKAVYWAAINKLEYARSIDPSVANKAARLISSYTKQLPDKSISFQLGHTDGEKYSIGCIVNETITVKF